MDRVARRPVMALIGNAGVLSVAQREAAEAIGEAAIDAGFRVVCGGRDGVMEAVMKGARRSQHYREGDTIGVLPTYDAKDASVFCDIVIPTGMGYARNVVVVASSDVVVAFGGGSGTLSEIALAWQLRRPILAWKGVGGWSERLAGEALDQRHPSTIEAVDTVEGLIARAQAVLAPELRDVLAARSEAMS